MLAINPRHHIQHQIAFFAGDAVEDATVGLGMQSQ